MAAAELRDARCQPRPLALAAGRGPGERVQHETHGDGEQDHRRCGGDDLGERGDRVVRGADGRVEYGKDGHGSGPSGVSWEQRSAEGGRDRRT
ncbi:hypothetical protein [Kitasatospora sp. NPDC059571]|uniref:hypothetical protein n=1 Tax=Kitasatospora sp. NPDC059571 TaxID=3346871 RepID=UPI00369E457A